MSKTSADEEFSSFSHRCVHESMARNERWNAEFHGFDMPRWDFSDQDSTLTFSRDGVAEVVCAVFIAGTTLNGRWQWSWANRTTDPQNQQASQKVFDYGAARDWKTLATPFQDADEFTGWENVSITSHVCDGDATYRFAYGDNNEYFAYLVITHTQKVNTNGGNSEF